MEFYSKNLREVYGETLVELGQKYDNVVVLDADLNTSTCTDKFKKRFPNRFIQCGIAEANMFSIAAGLAYLGFIPFPSTFAAFSTRKAFDPLFLNICCQQLNVKIPGSYPGLTATECGPSHNVCDDIAAIRALPHIKVADAGDNNELRSLMHAAVEEPGPVYFRVPKTELPKLFDESYIFQWGKGQQLREGTNITLAGTGMMTGVLLRAAEFLEKDGISAAVIHMASIKPLDNELLVKNARETGCVLTLENGRIYGGFGSAVSECLTKEYPVLVDMIGVEDEEAKSCDLGTLMEYYGMTPQNVVKHAKALVAKKK